MSYCKEEQKNISHFQPEEVVSNFEIIEFNEFDKGWKKTETAVAKESSLTIYLNGESIVTLTCSNNSKEFLALGFLTVEGFLNPEEARNIKITLLDERAVSIETAVSNISKHKEKKTVTPGLGRGITFSMKEDFLNSLSIKSSLRLSVNQAFLLMKKLTGRSTIHKLTRGVHNAAICTPCNLLIFQYDLGRHNAVDKLYGQCLMEEIPIQNKILVTSGRVSSEIVTKAGIMGVPFLISSSSPTDKAITLAKKIGLTLIGRVRGKKLSVYSYKERLTSS